ncbi:hypothetical protein A3305_05830 [Rickettsia amblyommatis]|uniref:Uncharacterized protein n=2 Tax=Rickettsia amblyommatis TaxID=33989 RepID=H8K5D0_RICAG|nr:hypothetical protein [Rickettsia amblyommatis]AFC69724.1 hypothetical protein MCE_04035 [Rickettsia amblyommatis str. GAT-30V]ALA61797.1 hypothetical protein AL573_03700 [Rickettsia amblyommatis]ARD87907.1 hypothetical protein A3305_05830 [Rickettsia amblyommatis]KJV62130.1 hypothetical protein APHACPA_1150 [Rickettsia amblyommatis str. Ac/Pa]KJV94886.1 hypothetical protein RAMDARK_0830 [Rickettsia amblyommatis str. Darkwater]
MAKDANKPEGNRKAPLSTEELYNKFDNISSILIVNLILELNFLKILLLLLTMLPLLDKIFLLQLNLVQSLTDTMI